MSKRVRINKDDKFVSLKIFDNLTREPVFIGKALLSNKKAVQRLFEEAESKGLFLR